MDDKSKAVIDSLCKLKSIPQNELPSLKSQIYKEIEYKSPAVKCYVQILFGLVE